MTRLLALFLALLLAVSPAVALTVSQREDAGYTAYDLLWQLQDLTLTEEATPRITAKHGIQVILPYAFPAIFDRSKATVTLFGTAVDTGKLNSTQTITFDSSARIATIAVTKDFAAGDTLTISGLHIKGFYSRTESDQRLGIGTAGDGTVQAESNRVVYIRYDGSARDDNIAPEAPDTFTVTTNGTTATLTWTPSVDWDIVTTEIYRKQGNFAFERLTSFPLGATTYTDTTVTPGATYTYTLRVLDERNASPFTAERTITITTPVACTLEYAPVCANGTTYGNRCQAEAAGSTNATEGACTSTPTTDTPSTETPDTSTPTDTGMLLPGGVTESEVAALTFPDIEKDAWYASYLARMVREGIVSGYPDGTARMDSPINRAEYARMVTRTLGLSEQPLTGFLDVPSDAWYATDIGALKAQNALWTDTPYYLPSGTVTREEAVFVLMRAAGYSTTKPSAKPFPDVPTRSPYAGAIASAKGLGIVGGKDDGTFDPTAPINRAEAAKILALLLTERDFH